MSLMRCTPTLARLYLDQGYVEEAIEIWESLMDREPRDPSFTEGLAEAFREKSAADTRRLVPLFRQWFYLLLNPSSSVGE